MYGQPIINRGAKAIRQRIVVFSKNCARTIKYPYAKKKKKKL